MDVSSEILYHLPYKYLDARAEVAAETAADGVFALLRGRPASEARVKFLRRGLNIATVSTADFSAVWFNRPYVRRNLSPGVEYLFFGKTERLKNGGLRLLNPMFERSDALKNLGRIIPLYRKFTASDGTEIPASGVRAAVRKAFRSASAIGVLPPRILKKYNLPPLCDALTAAHAPRDFGEITAALRSVSVENLSFKLAAHRVLRESAVGADARPPYSVTDGEIEDFFKGFAFELTACQRRAASDIIADLRSSSPMNRLLEGDVGSGKTAVAFAAAFMAAASGRQAAIMAPTEVLARQHYANALKVFSKYPFNITLVDGSMKKEARDTAYFNIKHGAASVVIGTHALLSANLEFRNLSLVVTDEQHRFGVSQRAALEKKGSAAPDLLTLSATPIPRTLSLAMYGDLSVSRLSRPASARRAQTRIVPAARAEDMYGYIRDILCAGGRAYFVCPRIGGNSADADGGVEIGAEEDGEDGLTAAEQLYGELKKKRIGEFGVRLLHGKMSEREKRAALTDFRSGRAASLVSTTVIEVGVDVPEASVMVIYDAERYGLAQLHQLRGRVGRAGQDAWCFLLSRAPAEGEAAERLEYFRNEADGFALAEYDFSRRGAGDFAGVKQHGGAGAPPLDAELIRVCREIAAELCADPVLRREIAVRAAAGGEEMSRVVFN